MEGGGEVRSCLERDDGKEWMEEMWKEGGKPRRMFQARRKRGMERGRSGGRERTHRLLFPNADHRRRFCWRLFSCCYLGKGRRAGGREGGVVSIHVWGGQACSLTAPSPLLRLLVLHCCCRRHRYSRFCFCCCCFCCCCFCCCHCKAIQSDQEGHDHTYPSLSRSLPPPLPSSKLPFPRPPPLPLPLSLLLLLLLLLLHTPHSSHPSLPPFHLTLASASSHS